MTPPKPPGPNIGKNVLRIRTIQWAIQSLVGICVFGLIARETSWGIWLLIAWILVIAANAVFLWKRFRRPQPQDTP